MMRAPTAAGYALHYGQAQTPMVRVEPDSVHPGMWRVVWPDGRVSDMVNLARAKDAAMALAERGPPARNPHRLHWRLDRASSTALRRGCTRYRMHQHSEKRTTSNCVHTASSSRPATPTSSCRALAPSRTMSMVGSRPLPTACWRRRTVGSSAVWSGRGSTSGRCGFPRSIGTAAFFPTLNAKRTGASASHCWAAGRSR